MANPDPQSLESAARLAADQQGDLQPFVAYQLEAIHDALRSEISSEISLETGSEICVRAGAAIDALILRDLAIEPTRLARSLAICQQLSQCAVEKHLAGSLANAWGIVEVIKSIRNQFQVNLSVFVAPPAEIQSMPHQRLFH